MKEAVIVSYARTPFTRAHKGELKDTRPDSMAAHVIKAAVERAPGLDPADIDDVLLGCAMPEGAQGMNVARIAALMAGLPETVSGATVNRFCSSGLQTIAQAAQTVMVGAVDVIIAGGTESMTMVPMGGGNPSASPEAMATYPEIYTPMGTTAENVAKKFEVARETQDAFAYDSHMNALQGQESGFLAGEIAPIETTVLNKQGKPVTVVSAKDDGPRASTSTEVLAKLRPVFNPKGTVTAGNASPLTDGAAAVVVMSKDKADELGLEPMGYFRGFQVAGVAPEIMGIGPVPAIRKLLAKHDLTVADIDLFEINEAFAAQASYCKEELGVEDDKINIHGGAIALGHPLGVSGTRMAGTLLRSLEKTGGRYGVVSMCIGGGMGAAGLFERVAPAEDAPKTSFYKQINGVRYKRALLDFCDEAVAGAGDGRISRADAEQLLALITSDNKYSQLEKDTVKYIRENYTWTDSADEWLRTEVRSWAATRGANS